MARKQKHAHHGGAWKVAYADFVTAMMALFLVLWLTSQDEKIKEAVERSFRNPFATVTKESTGIIPTKDTRAVQNKDGNFDSAAMVELNMLRKIAEELLKTLQNGESNPEHDAVKVEPIPEGVRISIFDKAQRPIFKTDSKEFTEFGRWVVTTVAWQVSRYTNTFRVELEGHTEKNQNPKKADYGEWDITTDRANETRRVLMDSGVSSEQIRKVAGFGDTQPLDGMPENDPVNRRVAVLLKVSGRKNEL
jgi:chemotaxis protein MotB